MKRSFGVLLVLSATFLAGGVVEAQTVFNFDTTGPTTTAAIPNFFDLLGFEPDLNTNWTIDPNTVNPANGSNALHTSSDGNQLEAWFSRVAILKPNVFFGQDFNEFSADITWNDNDNAGLYFRFTGNSDVPLENTFYHLHIGVDNGPPSSLNLNRVKDGVRTELFDEVDVPFAVSQGDTVNMKVSAVGNQIRVFIDDIPIPGLDPFIDPDPILGNGRVGIGQETNPTFFDNIVIPDSGTCFDPGDVDCNGLVDVVDFQIILNNFLASVTSRDQGDLTLDGVVNFADFREWKDNRTGGVAALAAVPEPTCLMMAAVMVGLGVFINRRKS